MDTKRPELSNDDNIFESTLESDNFTVLLDEDHAAPDRNDFVPEVTDISANEVPADDDLGGDSPAPYEADLFLTNEPHDDLELYELSDTDVEADHFETLSDDEYIISGSYDSESETDLLEDEVSADEELEAESREQLADDLLLTNEPHDDLTFDELIDADAEGDHSETLFDDEDIAFARSDSGSEADLPAEEVFADEEPEAESTEQLEYDLLLTDEPQDDLTFEELIDADLEGDHSETLADDEGIVFARSDSGSEADLLAEEVFADEEPEAESTELLEDDLLLTDAPHADLTFDELIDADVEGCHSEMLSEEEDIAFARADSSSETDLLTEEVFADEEPEAESTELFEDDLQFTDAPHADLTFDELIDADVEGDHSEILSEEEDIAFARADFGLETDLPAEEVFADEEQEAGSTELLEDDFQFTDEPLDGLNLKELFERGWETDESTEENGFDTVSELYGVTEKDDLGQAALATDNATVTESEVRRPVVVEKIHDKVEPDDVTKQRVSLQSSENLLYKSHGGFSAIESRQGKDKQLSKSVIVFAMLVVLGGGAGAWYGFNNIGNGTQALEQGPDGQGYQLNQDNLNRFAAQEDVKIQQPETMLREVEDSVKTQLNTLKEQLGTKTRKNSSELLNSSRAIRQLERRLVSVEKDLADYGGKEQTPQVVELAQQLKLMERLVQEPVKMNQDVTGELTLQLKQLDTSINQLENRVRQIRRQQDSMHSSLGSVERGIAEITSSVAAIQSDSPAEEIQKETESVQGVSTTPEDIPVSKRSAEVGSTVPVDTSNVQETPPQSDNIIPAEGVTPEQPRWVVNLASFKNRISAEKEQKRFNALGVKSIIHKAQLMGSTWYRVRVEGFSSVLSARRYMENIQLECDGIEDAWVSSCQF